VEWNKMRKIKTIRGKPWPPKLLRTAFSLLLFLASSLRIQPQPQPQPQPPNMSATATATATAAAVKKPLTVDKELHRHIVGTAGAVIRELQSTHSVRYV
jgi:hypothetical protein